MLKRSALLDNRLIKEE